MSATLANKKILLGVSGGIAAYKAVDLLRLLIREGASVYVAMSANAGKFVTPLTFQAISGHPVYKEVFDTTVESSMEHIHAAENADLLIVAPATANAIAKMAHGLADDALSTLFISFRGPVIVAPAMNDKMYANPAVRENLGKLRERGVMIVDAEHGELACGVVGQGRLAEPARLLDVVKKQLARTRDLSGVRLLVTAGPTREPLDPVRFITNNSSGKMGYAVAECARDRGAEVVLISGPTHLEKPGGMKLVLCQQAAEMSAQVLSYLPQCDVVVMTAAVGDFVPETIQKEKIKKRSQEPLVLKLIQTPDILREIAERKTHQVVVGFAAETQNLIENAIEKKRGKNLDLIVANDIGRPGIGFQSDFNQVVIIQNEREIEELPLMPKSEIAGRLLDKIRQLLRKKP